MKSRFIYIYFLFTITITVFVFVNTVNLSSLNVDEKRKAKLNCGKALEGFILCAKTEKQKFEIGEAVEIFLFLKNTNDEDRVIMNPKKTYKIEAKTESGESVNLTEKVENDSLHGIIIPGFRSGRYGITMKAKEELNSKIVLNEIYNLTQVGKFTIVAKRLVPKSNGEDKLVEITSNKIEIEIVEPQL